MSTAEILAVGTELLLGQVLDTNSQFLSDELARIGIDCYFHTTVGDNKARIKSSLVTALSRSEIVLMSGGLGPTADDLTIECVAEVFGAELMMDETILEKIETFFKERGIAMPESNKKQALRPRGADLLPNRTGTAPGIIWTIEPDLLEREDIKSVPKLASKPRYIITFPGVPSELKCMWAETVCGFLQETVLGSTIFSVELKHYGIGESALGEKYADLLEGRNPTVAPYAGNGECRLRVTAKSIDLDSARHLVEPVVEQIRKRSGDFLYGENDDTLQSVVGELLMKQKLFIAVAESCTGGLVSKRLTDVAGCSEYIGLNVVTYSNDAKERILEVPKEIIERHGAVSAETAEAMAKGVRRLSKADIGLSITGIAGPGGGTPEKPVGLVYVGLAYENEFELKELRYPSRLSRADIRHRTANEALNMVRLHLLSRCRATV